MVILMTKNVKGSLRYEEKKCFLSREVFNLFSLLHLSAPYTRIVVMLWSVDVVRIYFSLINAQALLKVLSTEETLISFATHRKLLSFVE